jgi:prefoldin subunit 5
MSQLQNVISEINNINDKIESYTTLIAKIYTLSDKVDKTSGKLKEAYTNLSEGLVINGDSADGGAIEAMSQRLSTNYNELQNIISTAKKERTKLVNQLPELYATKRRIEAEIRNSNIRKRREGA